MNDRRSISETVVGTSLRSRFRRISQVKSQQAVRIMRNMRILVERKRQWRRRSRDYVDEEELIPLIAEDDSKGSVFERLCDWWSWYWLLSPGLTG